MLTILEIPAALALFAAAVWQYSTFETKRLAARASRRFNSAARELDTGEMVSAARRLWKATKEYPEVMLAAADASARAGSPAEAMELYACVLDSNAPPEVKLPAKLGQVALSKGTPAELTRGLDEAAGYATDSPDVELSRAIAQALAGERREALSKIESALGGLKRGRAAFLSTLWSAYVTAAVCEVDAGRMEEALDWLERARGLKPPSARELAPLQLRLRLLLAARTGADTNLAKSVLAEIETQKDLKLTAAESYDFALGRATAYLNTDNTEKAVVCLEEAVKTDPDRVDAHVGLAFVKYRMQSRRRRSVVQKAEAHYESLARERKPEKKWTRLLHRRPPPTRRLARDALKAAVELHAAEEGFIARLRGACDSGKLSAEQANAMRWFLALVYLRQARSLSNEPEAEERLGLAEEMLRVVVSDAPGNAAASRALGALGAMKGDERLALEAFKKSLAAEPAQEDLSKVVEVLSLKPEVRFQFPGRVARCAAPLIGAAVNVRGWKGLDPELSKVFLDGREVPAAVLPTAVCHIPPRALSDGTHPVKLVLVDAGGNSTETSFTFAVDGTPPKVASFSPGRGETVSGPRLPIKIALSDAHSGVRVESVKVVLLARGGMMRFKDLLVDRGRYVRGNPSLGVTYRAGRKIDPSNFTVVNWRSLQPGEYEVEIHAADLLGNEMPVFKTTIAVGGAR